MQQLLGLLLASLITAWATALYLPRMAALETQRHDNGAAAQFAAFTEAAQRFLVAERTALTAEFILDPLSFPRSFGGAELIAAGALSARFQEPNTLRQNHALLVRGATVGTETHFEGLAVTFDGRALDATESGRLALLAGPRAGRVHADRPGEVWGAGGQWMVPVAEFAGGAVPPEQLPGPGHFAALVSTLGAPPAATPSLTPVGLQAHGDLVPKPVCATGTARIYVLPVQFSDNGDGFPVLGVQAFAQELPDGSAWQVRLNLFREDPNAPASQLVEVDAAHGRAAVFTSCV